MRTNPLYVTQNCTCIDVIYFSVYLRRNIAQKILLVTIYNDNAQAQKKKKNGKHP